MKCVVASMSSQIAEVYQHENMMSDAVRAISADTKCMTPIKISSEERDFPV